MRRSLLVLACFGCLSLAACAAAPEASPVAPAAAAQAAALTGPGSCPAKTDILYKPEIPQAGFVPAAPRGSTVVAPKRIHASDPAYPSASRTCHEEGKVVITYCIGADGKMENVQVIVSSGFARLDNATLAWASRETHTPGTVDGRARRYCGLSLEQAFDYMEERGQTAVIAK